MFRRTEFFIILAPFRDFSWCSKYALFFRQHQSCFFNGVFWPIRLIYHSQTPVASGREPLFFMACLVGGALLILRRLLKRYNSGMSAGRNDSEPGGRRDVPVANAEQQLQQLVDTALDAVITCDDRSRITVWNNGAEKLFGWTAAEAIGLLLTETIIPVDFSRGPQSRHGELPQDR